MFGVAIARLDQVSEAEKARYRACYCGLCRALRERYGQASRAVLSYDLAFLAIFLDSLSEGPQACGAEHCIAHPAKKMPYAQGAGAAYAADLSVALAYHKVLDDVADDGTVRARAAEAALRRSYGRAAERIPEECAAIEDAMDRIRALEAAPGTPPDACACEFGRLLALIFANGPRRCAGAASPGLRERSACAEGGGRLGPAEAPGGSAQGVDASLGADAAWLARWEAPSAAFGYGLGRLIYMMDAAVDLPRDRRSGSYNPFAGLGMDAGQMRAVLQELAGEAADAFERLPLVRDAQLMRAVLYAGIWQEFNRTYDEQPSGPAGPDPRQALRRPAAGGSGEGR